MCRTIADVINAKKVTCFEESMYTKSNILLTNEFIYNIATGDKLKREVTPEKMQAATLACTYGENLTDNERDEIRAKTVREKIFDKQ